jgi:hypothetical protein
VHTSPSRAARGGRAPRRIGTGPAGKILARVGTVHRFRSVAAFAFYPGTAPIEVSSGEVKRHRLSRTGDRQLNHALHLMALSQIRHDTEGRAYHRRKRAAGKSHKEAVRCLKRRLSDVVYRQLLPDAHHTGGGPGTSALRTNHFPDPPATTLQPKHKINLAQRGAVPVTDPDTKTTGRWCLDGVVTGMRDHRRHSLANRRGFLVPAADATRLSRASTEKPAAQPLRQVDRHSIGRRLHIGPRHR